MTLDGSKFNRPFWRGYRCVACREANRGTGCFISACTTTAGRSCDCHASIGQGSRPLAKSFRPRIVA
jgi:hypothetical protein